jgi:hypothetical protein
MSSKDKGLYEKLEREAHRRGVLEALRTLMAGTKDLTDWQPQVGRKANFIRYDDPGSKRWLVRYGWRVSPDLQTLDANVNMRNNQFGSGFGLSRDEVFDRLKGHLPDAVRGIKTRGEDYVAIRHNVDAEQFLAFLKSFLDRGEA